MSDGTDSRPQFGAYASPEEQRARSGVPAPEVDPALIPRDMPPGAEVPAPRGGARRRSSAADRVLTVLLMAFGLYYVLNVIGLYTDPSALVDAMRLDVELSDYAGQRMAGVVAVVILIVGWLATTWLVWRRGSAGRSMWWIALIAGVVFMVVGGLIVAIPFALDPAVMDAVLQGQGIAP